MRQLALSQCIIYIQGCAVNHKNAIAYTYAHSISKQTRANMHTHALNKSEYYC